MRGGAGGPDGPRRRGLPGRDACFGHERRRRRLDAVRPGANADPQGAGADAAGGGADAAFCGAGAGCPGGGVPAALRRAMRLPHLAAGTGARSPDPPAMSIQRRGQ